MRPKTSGKTSGSRIYIYIYRDLWGWLQVATKIIIPNSIRSSWWNGGSLGRKQIAVGAKILESNAIWILFIPWDCRKQILLHVQTLLIWRIQLYQKPTTNTIAQHVPCNIFIHFPKFSLASATGLLTCTLLQSLIGPFRKPPHENSSNDSPDLWTPRRLFICNETLTLRRVTWRSEKSVLVAPPEKWCKHSKSLKQTNEARIFMRLKQQHSSSKLTKQIACCWVYRPIWTLLIPFKTHIFFILGSQEHQWLGKYKHISTMDAMEDRKACSIS